MVIQETNDRYSIQNIEKRIKSLEESKKEYSITNIVDESYKSKIKCLKDIFIKEEKQYKRFFTEFVEMSLSERYRFSVLRDVNTLKDIFQRNKIDFLSFFIYINDIFVKYRDKDVSIVLRTITKIIYDNENNRIFIDKINHCIKTGQYNILFDEKYLLEIFHSSLVEGDKQKKVNSLVEEYFEDFKRICK